MTRLFLICLLTTFASPVFAAYKCSSGNEVFYSDTPCRSGKQEIVDSASLNAADHAEAKQRAEREKKELKQLENTRHKREAKEEKEQQQAAKKAASHKKKCASLAQKRKWSEEDAANASSNSAEKTKLKARRAAEKYALECGQAAKS